MRKYTFTIGGNTYQVDIKSLEENIAEIEVNGTIYTVELGKEIQPPKTPKLVRYTPPPPEAPEQLTKQGPSVIKAPLPGTIIDIKVQRGQQVRREQTLIVLEAMKMENNILAEKDGVVKSITVSSGSTVMQGDILMEIE